MKTSVIYFGLAVGP